MISYCLILVCAAAVIVYRRPDAVTNPQFWAEYGTYWFAESYNNGFLIPFLTAVHRLFANVFKIICRNLAIFPAFISSIHIQYWNNNCSKFAGRYYTFPI